MTARDNHPDRGGMEPLPPTGLVGAALMRARELCLSEGLGATMQARLAIVIEELLLNLIDHGGQPVIALSLRRCEGGVRVVIEDDGAPFDPRGARQAELPPERGGGAGIALMLAWSDVLSYARDGGRNRLDLIVRDCD